MVDTFSFRNFNFRDGAQSTREDNAVLHPAGEWMDLGVNVWWRTLLLKYVQKNVYLTIILLIVLLTVLNKLFCRTYHKLSLILSVLNKTSLWNLIWKIYFSYRYPYYLGITFYNLPINVLSNLKENSREHLLDVD